MFDSGKDPFEKRRRSNTFIVTLTDRVLVG